MEYWLLLSIPLLYVLFQLIRKEAVFIPLPMRTVRKMLALAKIKKGDVLYDLGSGDGRVLITAAQEFGVKAVGIERSKFFVWISRMNIKLKGLQDKTKVVEGDFFKHDLRKATVVTAYLSQRLNDELQPKLEKELRKGTRVLSADHEFKDWKEIKRIKTGHFYTRLYKI